MSCGRKTSQERRSNTDLEDPLPVAYLVLCGEMAIGRRGGRQLLRPVPLAARGAAAVLVGRVPPDARARPRPRVRGQGQVFFFCLCSVFFLHFFF